MAVSGLIAPSTINLKQTFTATASGTLYTAAGLSLSAGTYTVTCPSAAISYVDFYSGLTLLTSAVTASGTVDVSIASNATMIKYWSNTSNTSIGILLSGNPITTAVSGTLDTITATTNAYAGSGQAGYVVAVGGGGGGASGGTFNNNVAGGGGGGAGACGIGYISSLPSVITIGAGGNGSAVSGNLGVVGNPGGTTTCGTVVANGGSGGNASVGGVTGGSSGGTTSNTGGVTGAGGGGCATSASNGSPGGATAQTSYTHVKLGTNGGGGGGSAGNSSTTSASGGGSGIGTGGSGGVSGPTPSVGSVGTGFGAGGGGGGAGANTGTGQSGGAGSAGVVYIVRFNS